MVTATIIDGRAIAAELRAEVAERVSALKKRGVQAGIAVVLVGDDPGSRSYVKAKAKACTEAGMYSETVELPNETTEHELSALIERLNNDDRVHGILLQLPIADHLDPDPFLMAVDLAKDVDGLHPINQGRLLAGQPGGPFPATPSGVLELLRRTGNDPAGKHVVVIGRSILVGRPVAMLLANKAEGANATVTLCHTGTKDLAAFTKQADIIVVAAGRPSTVTADMVKPGVVIIDVGTNRIEDSSRKRGWRIVGDADFEGLLEVASWITKVPGGVGPMTIAMLLQNTVEAAERSAGRKRPAG